MSGHTAEYYLAFKKKPNVTLAAVQTGVEDIKEREAASDRRPTPCDPPNWGV